MKNPDDLIDLSLPLSRDGRYPEFRPLSAAVKVEFGACSHAGHLHATNDDHHLIVRLGRHQETLATSLPDGAVPSRFDECGYGMVVADGMGGAGSEQASRLAIATLAQLVLRFGKWNVRINDQTAWEVVQRAERFYRHVDETVTQAAHAHPALSGMGTTLTAAYSGGNELFIAHVGHSRAYLCRSRVLTRLTRDQTVAQRVAESGRSGPTELAAWDLRHVLTDAIGGRGGETHVAIDNFPLLDGDLVLVCTNGLTDVVEDDQIGAILCGRGSVTERCQALVDLALARGGPDNITVLLARYEIP